MWGLGPEDLEVLIDEDGAPTTGVFAEVTQNVRQAAAYRILVETFGRMIEEKPLRQSQTQSERLYETKLNQWVWHLAELVEVVMNEPVE